MISAFWGLLMRDLRVLGRELVPFVLRVGMQPLLFLFVFTDVMPRMTGGNPMAGGATFGTVLLPGLMAMAIMFSGIAGTALPLSSEFGITREIDDRVMCPAPVWLVAIEKVCFAALQSMVAALLVIPMAIVIPAKAVYPHIGSNPVDWLLGLLVLVLSSLLSGALGLAIGSLVPPKQIGLIFSIIVVPIAFLGCVYYPWAYLGSMRWLQIGVLFNPLVYMTEGLREVTTPEIPHMPTWAVLSALVFFVLLLGRIGVRGFLKRVIS